MDGNEEARGLVPAAPAPAPAPAPAAPEIEISDVVHAIESFKALIAAQDVRNRELLDELAQVREQHACSQAELEGARSMAERAEAHRQHA